MERGRVRNGIPERAGEPIDEVGVVVLFIGSGGWLVVESRERAGNAKPSTSWIVQPRDVKTTLTPNRFFQSWCGQIETQSQLGVSVPIVEIGG
jgi:hypothetical protein